MSLRKMSEIVPEVMEEITQLFEQKDRERRARERVNERACNAVDLQAENQPVDPRMRARRGCGGRQLELGLTTITR